MSPETYFVPEVEIKSLLVAGIFMLAGLALSFYLSLKPNAAERKLSLSLACALGCIGFFVGNTVRSLSYHGLDQTTAAAGILSPLFLMLIAYAAVWVVCSCYVQYRRQGKDPELAPALIRNLVWALAVVAAAVISMIVAICIRILRG